MQIEATTVLTEKERILKSTRPEELFPGNLETAKDEYKKLARKWHPDFQNGSTSVMSHINKLYDEAVLLIQAGKWPKRGILRLNKEIAGTISFRFLASRPFSLGHLYLGETHLSYLVEKKHLRFAERSLSATESFRYANHKMESEISKYLPNNVTPYLLKDSRCLIKIPKVKEMLCLRDVLSFYGKRLKMEEVAWIGSGMHNIACYLYWAGIVHSNFSLDSVFINPSTHDVALLGEWWFASRRGERLRHLPARTVHFLPWEVQVRKEATYLIDLETIRATLRELMGDITGKDIECNPLSEWAQTPATKKPNKEYANWHSAIKKTFGRRRFVKMALNSETLYSSK